MNLTLKTVLLTLVCAVVSPFAAADAVFETDTFRYNIGGDGSNISLFDKIGGKEYLRPGEPSACALVRVEGKEYPASAATLEGDILHLTFKNGSLCADIKVVSCHDYLIFEVVGIVGEPDAIVFVNVPLDLEAKPYEPFAACALALTPFTHVHQLPALHNAYRAEATNRFGMVGAKAALIGCPQSDILPAIRETMSHDAEDIPFSDKGGAWALSSDDGYGSYQMNFGTLTEETVDSWIESCRRLGFNQIDNHGGGFFSFGSLDNRQPGGWDSFKRVIDRCHDAGIKVILHTYTCFIGKDDRYVTPVPHPDLDTLHDWRLAEPIDARTDEITVLEPIDPEFLQGGWMTTSCRTLRIGDEIVKYTDATKEAPWKFLGCQRGFHNTRAAAHDSGTTASLLKTFWDGMYVPKPDSPLWYEIAKNHSDLINRCGFDGIYFDAIEGIQYMWGEENYWYYGGKFVMDVAKDLNRPVGMEFAGMIHQWWHYRSRYQAWDYPVRGYKRFLDVHLGSMKAGEEYQHGCWLGHDPKIDKFAGLKEGGLYLPFQLGWWNLSTWKDPSTEPTYGDDVDYIGCKMVGNNAGFSFSHPVDIKKIDADPFLAGCVSRIHDYEKARRADLDESILAKLRQPKREYRLYHDADGTPWFREMFYKRHKIIDVSDDSAAWNVENEFVSQPISLRLTAFYSPAAYDDPMKAVRFDPAKVSKDCEGNRGVTGTLEPDVDRVPATGESAFAFTASHTGEVPDDAAWVRTDLWRMPKSSDPKTLRTTGFWLCGDGLGEVLNVQLGCCSHLVKIDFTGWKYIELLEADSTQLSHYVWPPMGYTVYTHYRETGNLDECRIWYNNVPTGKTVRCLLGPIVALPYRENELKNPIVTVNGQAIRFPITLETGSYFELRDGKCIKYRKDGVPAEEFTPSDPIPLLKKGENRLSVTAEASLPTGKRMELTVIGEGDRLQ
jgi:hypothetical protein